MDAEDPPDPQQAQGRHAPVEPGGPGPTATPDLERLLRWEESGGGWRVAGVGRGHLTLSLVTCDGGEEMGVLSTADPRVLEHVGQRRRHP